MRKRSTKLSCRGAEDLTERSGEEEEEARTRDRAALWLEFSAVTFRAGLACRLCGCGFAEERPTALEKPTVFGSALL